MGINFEVASRHLYCQDVPQMSQTLILSGCLPDVSDTCIARTPVNILQTFVLSGCPGSVHTSAFVGKTIIRKCKTFVRRHIQYILYSTTSLLCSNCHTNTSVMIHHRGTNLSKQQTDLSLHKAIFCHTKVDTLYLDKSSPEIARYHICQQPGLLLSVWLHCMD